MIKLCKPYIPEIALKDAIKVMESGNLVQGKYVQTFEEALCKYLDVKYAVVVSSGTAALHLALLSAGIKENDEVIIPAFTFPATANVIEVVGAKPVLIDINLDDFCINTSLIEHHITPRTKAIMPVHEFGQPAKMDDILMLAEKFNLVVIEDAACALGTEYHGQKAGTIGTLGCFSFHPRKAITTGEGGAIVTNDRNLADKLRIYRNHGIDSKNPGKFDFIEAGLNYRMTEFQAVLGISQLGIIEDIIKKKIETAYLYNKLLSKVEWIKVPPIFNDRRMVYQTYHLLLDEKINRDGLINYLRNNNIETNFGAYALNKLTYFKEKYILNEADYLNSVRSYCSGLALPMSFGIIKEEIETVTRVIKGFTE